MHGIIRAPKKGVVIPLLVGAIVAVCIAIAIAVVCRCRATRNEPSRPIIRSDIAAPLPSDRQKPAANINHYYSSNAAAAAKQQENARVGSNYAQFNVAKIDTNSNRYDNSALLVPEYANAEFEGELNRAN